MRALLLLAAAAAGATAAACSERPDPPRARPAANPEQATERQQAAEQSAAEQRARTALALEIGAQIEAGTASPAAEAAAAAAGRGDFGLLATSMLPGAGLRTPGLICFTPGRAPPRIRALYTHGDAILPRDTRWSIYAADYNRALAARVDYPDADLCRAETPDDRDLPRDEQAATRPARAVAGAPRSLHEAARRGSAADVQRLLGTTAVNALDGLEMTALAWAVARNNGPAIEALLAAGADPWIGGQGDLRSAVGLAAALGRSAWFVRLAALPGRPFERWSRMQIRAAGAGGSPAILAQMLREPHDPVGQEMLPNPLPPVALADLLLRDNPAIATPLLRRAADRESRPDLVRLALARGADPNAAPPQGGMETPLGSAASANSPQSLEIVDLLLRAGADPNAISWRRRPLWIAVQTMRIGQRDGGALDRNALTIFERLRAGGADINLPDYQGRPPIWTLLFPQTYAHRQLDSYYVTPALLAMLARAGLDLNARWEGDRVLTEVERQAGRESELAVTLRRLGARR